jgi:uroporphyrinogen-III synthase
MLPQLQALTGKRVLIVRGDGGLPHLGEHLQARGAEVRYAEVYRRAKPLADSRPLLEHWVKQIDLVTATSVEVLNNLTAMLGETGWPLLKHTPLLVVSQRMHEAAQKMGFEIVIVAKGAGDDAIMAAITRWLTSGDRSPS